MNVCHMCDRDNMLHFQMSRFEKQQKYLVYEIHLHDSKEISYQNRG